MDPQVGVTRTRSLVVRSPAEDRGGAYHWVVADENGDGFVDRAQGYELGRDEFGRLTLTESGAPEDRRDAIQAYFDDAGARLLAAAGRDIPDQCR